LVGHPAIISEVIYSPDGKLIASADMHGTIRLWNAESGEMLKEIREAGSGPVHLLFLADSRTLVLGSGDGTLRFYQVP
jgi:WD40 repeat protein